MQYYCHAGNASAILHTFRGMRESSGVHFDVDTYALIIGSLAKLRVFCVNSIPIEGPSKAGFESTHGPDLLDEIAAEMAEDMLELTEAAALNLLTAFTEGFSPSEDPELDEVDEIPMISDEGEAPNGVKIGRVNVDEKTAVCRASGAKLRLFALNEAQRQHVHDTLLVMARQQYLDFTKKQKRQIDDGENYAVNELSRFSKWLE